MRQRDRGDGLPRCYNVNIPSYAIVNDGYEASPATGLLSLRQAVVDFGMTRECRAWASDPSTDPVPLAEAWRCEGCCRYPAELVELALQRREARRR